MFFSETARPITRLSSAGNYPATKRGSSTSTVMTDLDLNRFNEREREEQVSRFAAYGEFGRTLVGFSLLAISSRRDSQQRFKASS